MKVMTDTPMIGLVLVTHGGLAKEFVVAMEHVVGKQDAIATICIGPEDDMEERRQEIATAIADVDGGRGVIVLTDLFGGTPSNLAISLLDTGRVEVIAGINLPMLIRLGGARKTMKVTEAVVAARDAGRKYISVASEVLGEAASAKFVTLASSQPIEVVVEKDGSRVTGTSIMGLMMLGAAMGDEIVISAKGDSAEHVVATLAQLVEDRFGED
jgi:mannose PTS system EIIA component